MLKNDTQTRRASDGDRLTAAKRTDGAPKLRSTCDRCSSLKVRCDKQRPRCERCASADVPCAYGPFRWKGRATAASASRKSVSLPVSSAPLENNIVVIGAQPVSSTSAGNWDSGNTATQIQDAQQPSPMTSPNLNPCSFAPLQSLDESMNFDWDPMAPPVDEQDVNSWYTRFTDVEQDNGDEHDAEHNLIFALDQDHMNSVRDNLPFMETPNKIPPLFSTLHRPPRSESLSDSTSSGSTARHSSSLNSLFPAPCNCSSLAFTALQEMYQAEFRSRLAPGLDETGPGFSAMFGSEPQNASMPFPRSEQVVSITRAAVQQMEQLLLCNTPTCACDPILLFTVTALAFKLLAWYRTAFSKVTQQLHCSLIPGIGEMQDSKGSDLTFATTVHFGDFDLDFGSEQRMKAQFLLCEIRNLSRVLDLFGARAMAGMLPEEGKTPRELPISAVHQYITASLNQLATTIKEYCVS